MRDYAAAPYLVLATRDGMVKKTRLEEFDSNRSGGVIAINLRDDDELISAQLVDDGDDLLLVSAKGMSVRFTAERRHAAPDGSRDLRRHRHAVPRGRPPAGDGHRAARVRTSSPSPTAATRKRTPVDDWTPKGRGIYGVRAMKLVEERGSLVGALVANEDDEVYAIASDGVVIRTRVAEIRATGRDTMGVSLMDVSGDNAIVAVARGDASDDDEDGDDEGLEVAGDGDATDAPTPAAESDGAESVTVIDEDLAPAGDGEPATDDQ